jgi:hypothetical protein
MGVADVWPEPPYLWSIESVQDTIILKWQSGSAGCGDTASHYEVYRNFQDSSWSLISTIPLTQKIYYDVPSESGKYCYYVTLVTYYRELKSWENLCINITDIRDEYDLNKNKHTIFQIRNYPNPFNPSTTIEFTLPKSEFVELKVYNILGKEVSTLVSNKLNSGNYTYTFDGKNLASGVYYYQISAGDFREVKKMILLR